MRLWCPGDVVLCRARAGLPEGAGAGAGPKALAGKRTTIIGKLNFASAPHQQPLLLTLSKVLHLPLPVLLVRVRLC